MESRKLEMDDFTCFWNLKLLSLKEYPNFLGSSFDQLSKLPIETAMKHLPCDSENFFMGAYLEKKLVGFVGYKREQYIKMRHKGTVYSMYISSHLQRHGIGKMLLEELFSNLRLTGIEQINLYVNSDNLPAKKMYLNFGFKVYGREVNAFKENDKYSDGELMTLFLSE